MYVALVGSEVVALLGWAAAALKCGVRDRFIGWDELTKAQNLGFVVNNVRFLVLPWIHEKNLASRVLGANLRRLSSDWQEKYGHPVYLAETFVDARRFRGTCYRASNWLELGETRGWARSGGTYRLHGERKLVFVYKLSPRALELLRAPEPKEQEVRRFSMIDVEKLPLRGQGSLVEEFQALVDPRKARGKRFQLWTILSIAACATLSGARSIAGIAQWARELPREVLERLGCRRKNPPSEKTYRRAINAIGAERFEQTVGGWIARQTALNGGAISIDGKTVRGSADGEAPAVHLLSACTHEEGAVIAQVQVPGKTNEIPCVKELLKNVNIENCVVTTDAMHTQEKTAQFLVEEKKADYVFTVKENQPGLRKDIADLNLEDAPPQVTSVQKGHGRIETRRLWATDQLPEELVFPHAQQVYRIERITTKADGSGLRKEVVYGITSLSSAKGGPERLLELNRGHWGIENRVHWVRDVTFDEDRCRVRKGAVAQIMAALRNLAITLLRRAGAKNIAAALRHCARYVEKALRLIGL